jgi:cysteine desulfurase family protein (TIGR01976 family)
MATAPSPRRPSDEAPTLDVGAARARFPSLARTLPNGHRAAFLDGPGGSQAPGSVIQAIADYMRRSAANEGGPFATSVETGEVIVGARVAASDFTGSAPEEIVFGPNMTTLNFLLAHAVARTLARGDEIVVTDLDHDANVAPWLAVAADHGLTIRHAPIRVEDGTLDLEGLEATLGPRTRVVAFTLASNALGTIPDAGRIVAAAHRVGALAWADAVHFAPHRRIERHEMGIDVLLCSPYKFFGPHAGIASVRRDLAETLPADRVRPAPQTPPGHRFETGTPSFEALAGVTACIDYIASLGEGAGNGRRLALDRAFDAIEAHEQGLTARALAGFAEIPGVRLFGIADPARIHERTPTFCFTVEGRTPRAVAEALGEEGLFVWDGNYYALGPMTALGLEDHGGAVRAGALHYTTAEEIDRLLSAVRRLARR